MKLSTNYETTLVDIKSKPVNPKPAIADFKHKLGTPTKDVNTDKERAKSGTAEELLYAIRNKEVENLPLGMAYFYLEAPKMSFDSPNLKVAMENWEQLKGDPVDTRS